MITRNFLFYFIRQKNFFLGKTGFSFQICENGISWWISIMLKMSQFYQAFYYMIGFRGKFLFDLVFLIKFNMKLVFLWSSERGVAYEMESLKSSDFNFEWLFSYKGGLVNPIRVQILKNKFGKLICEKLVNFPSPTPLKYWKIIQINCQESTKFQFNFIMSLKTPQVKLLDSFFLTHIKKFSIIILPKKRWEKLIWTLSEGNFKAIFLNCIFKRSFSHFLLIFPSFSFFSIIIPSFFSKSIFSINYLSPLFEKFVSCHFSKKFFLFSILKTVDSFFIMIDNFWSGNFGTKKLFFKNVDVFLVSVNHNYEILLCFFWERSGSDFVAWDSLLYFHWIWKTHLKMGVA